MSDFFLYLFTTLLRVAPYLVLGFVAVALIKAYIPPSLLQRWLGQRGIKPLLNAVGIGALLPLCSCSTIPLGLGFVKNGAARGTALAFMTSAPAISPLAVMVAYGMLGPQLLACYTLGVLIGSLVLGFVGNLILSNDPIEAVQSTCGCDTNDSPEKSQKALREKALAKNRTSSCCASESGATKNPTPDNTTSADAAPANLVSLQRIFTYETSAPGSVLDASSGSSASTSSASSSASPVPSDCCSTVILAPALTSCCTSQASTGGTDSPEEQRMTPREAFKWAINDFAADVSLDLLIGLGVAAIILAWVPTSFIGNWLSGDNPLAVLLAILVGIPIYTCSVASIPVVQGLIWAGAGPGVALAYLIAGPATNLGEINAIRKSLGSRAATFYFSAITLLALSVGIFTNSYFQELDAKEYLPAAAEATLCKICPTDPQPVESHPTSLLNGSPNESTANTDSATDPTTLAPTQIALARKTDWSQLPWWHWPFAAVLLGVLGIGLRRKISALSLFASSR